MKQLCPGGISLLLLLTIAVTNCNPLDEEVLEELVREIREYKLDKRAVNSKEPVNDTIKSTPLVAAGAQGPSVRIGAFNIQVFGDRKYSKTMVKQYLMKIIPRYDALLIQEIRDADGDSFFQLIMDLNNIRNYEFELSERLGRTSSKEQYAYIFDPSKFQAESSYQYADKGDDFERPPFGVVLKTIGSAIGRFGLLGLHSKPSAAPQEISKMADVYDDFKEKFKLEDVILFGDFNAGCSYVYASEWADVVLRTDKRFTWWIGDDADTTVARSDCAYDRIVSAGKNMKRAIVPGSVSVFKFDAAYGLRRTKADDISDHYPVEFALHGKLSSEAKNIKVRESFSVSEQISIDVNDLLSKNLDYTATSHGDSLVQLEKLNIPCGDVVGSLNKIKGTMPSLLSSTLIASVDTYLSTGILDHVYRFPGNLDDPEANCDVIIDCKKDNVDVRVSKRVL